MQSGSRFGGKAAACTGTHPDPEPWLADPESRFRQAGPNDMIPVDFEAELTQAR
jgi:hypothetical protein